MKVLIINTNRNRFPFPVVPIGACMVADAAQKAGHEVSLLDMMFEKDPHGALHREIIRRNADVIGLSVRNIDNNDMRSPYFYLNDIVSYINTIRGLSAAPVILGGAAVSVMPEEVLRHTGATWAVTGDGETAFRGLLDRLSHAESPRDVPGVAWLEDGVFHSNPYSSPENICSCVSPAFSRWIDIGAYLRRFATIPLQSKLGCRFNCVYCTYRKIEGGAYRLSDPDEVADTVAGLAARGSRCIEFVDNVFNSPYEHALAISDKIAGAGCGAALMSLEMNPLFIDDELITVMERAGFTGIGITVESASDRVLEGLRKGFSSRHVHKAADVVRRHNIPCVWIFMMGGPGETQDTVKETLRFAENSILPRDVAFFGTGVRIYPGTELELIARDQGLLRIAAGEMLEPVFYVSPSVEYGWMRKRVKASMNRHMNFINPDSISLPVLPAIHRLGYSLGLRPPLWKYTRYIRRTLRTVGMDA
ncbi:MAG: cobalamin B12-binding domain-containing protein [Nitrospirae bacterium]|nr:cobalamin B12-binding domain-containing protein [Nitrospirota bacterium]